MKSLDDFWNTEPFGYDHPDTYNGIKELIEEREVEILLLKNKLNAALARITQLEADMKERK